MSWHDQLRPASFRGAEFKVLANSTAGGRRGQTSEFPHNDETDDADMGRRARRWIVTGYTIGSDYHLDADALEDALESGPGLLILPIMGEADCRCEVFTRVERKNEGGIATFEMNFVESPRPQGPSATSPEAGASFADRVYMANVDAVASMNASVKAGPR